MEGPQLDGVLAPTAELLAVVKARVAEPGSPMELAQLQGVFAELARSFTLIEATVAEPAAPMLLRQLDKLLAPGASLRFPRLLVATGATPTDTDTESNLLTTQRLLALHTTHRSICTGIAHPAPLRTPPVHLPQCHPVPTLTAMLLAGVVANVTEPGTPTHGGGGQELLTAVALALVVVAPVAEASGPPCLGNVQPMIANSALTTP
mmetsp:Transcript_130882/g.298083  ORF Transcript_130882/g.298083 Transcript_130882/m.298083 type:complete len:206 (+) Transcript_130882:1621-2238(+)|eukprot:CAMPEP_0204350684 /NCGR_PEP_ID=MMETSP0469-20131031/30538_1 /ASSEMBLY_ACC=CAM_ASM_000384 /TAXON_ID=2969 /ORGANISM="Oxyrrhis marina" /LENGTH=205 /DNA_ID=CAMNT_0051337085 /DNA_START=243 /DNA_END=860 /DNA_ORIENTATION=+